MTCLKLQNVLSISIFLLLVLQSHAADVSGAIDADPSNFDDLVLNSGKFSLVGFFAPWCGHCKAMKPTWNKIAELYKDEPHVQIISVDADKHGSLGQKYGVSGFPTLKFFGTDKAKPLEYDQGRDVQDFVNYLNEKTGADVAVDGGVSSSGGLVPSVHDSLKGFRSAAADAQENMLVEAEKLTAGDSELAKRWGYYKKVGRKIIDSGIKYVAEEKKRLTDMISNAGTNISPEQRKNIQRRLNVLNVFDEL